LTNRHAKGAYDQEWTLTLTAAQVNATLALAATTVVGIAGPNRHVWVDVAATSLNAGKLEPSTDNPPGSDPYRGGPAPVSAAG
jgi:hypothetical protein